MILFYINLIYCTVNIKLFFIVNLVREAERGRAVERVRQGSVGAGDRRRQLTPAAAARVPRDLTVPRVVRAEQRGDRGENAQPDIIVIF